MIFSYSPPDAPLIWMRFTPAEETNTPAKNGNFATQATVATDVPNETISVQQEETQTAEEVSTAADGISEEGISEEGISEEGISEEGISADGVSKEDAGVHISSVDQRSQLRGSQLARREYQRDSIRMRKGRAMLSPLVWRLNIAQESAQEKNVERAVRKMCGPNLGLSSDGSEVVAKTRGRCTDETAVDARVNVDPAGSQIKSSRVARRPLWKNCRNHRLCCPKIDWLYCPSPAADSDYLSLPQMMTSTRTRRQQRVTSSQLSSNVQVDSD